MNDALDISAVLEKAASSPDPAVRTAATHYYKLKKEIEDLDGFFSFYGRAQGEVSVLPKTRMKPPVFTSRKPDLFMKQVQDLLTEYGEPMKLNDLFAAFWERYPQEDRTSPETFRGRLNKKRDKGLVTFNGGKYWIPPQKENGLAA